MGLRLGSKRCHLPGNKEVSGGGEEQREPEAESSDLPYIFKFEPWLALVNDISTR